MIEIKNRWTDAILKTVDAADLSGADLRRAYLRGAYLRRADLRGADLSEADLRRAYLRGAYLRGADLRGADLSEADLRRADLRGAYLRGADLRGADLSEADLRRADLRGAYLRGADLRGADLRGADLRGADLRGAYLRGADLRGADLDPLAVARLSITPMGRLVGYKKLAEGVAELEIPAEAKRSNATGRKCRAEYAVVISLPEGCEVGHSLYMGSFEYRVGETVHPDSWCEDRWQECAPGIHFYLTREEAEAHS